VVATVVRYDLNEQVYDAIKARLLTREFAPGTRLSLQQLADELDVSRTPVHHALTRLVSDGLVLGGRRSYVVRPITAALMLEGHDVRLALEHFAAEATVGHVTARDLAEFRMLVDATDALVADDRFTDVSAYVHANNAFHEFQIGLARNETLLDIYRSLAVHRLMERALVPLTSVGADNATSEHRRIVDAYEAGDLGAARDTIRVHIETAKRMALRALEASGGTI
jgi:GntR family transcriptional regulator, rspAB operon transcriptional repressor